MTAYLEQLINRSRTSFKQLKRATTLERNQALTNIADSLAANTETILAANQKGCQCSQISRNECCFSGSSDPDQ